MSASASSSLLQSRRITAGNANAARKSVNNADSNGINVASSVSFARGQLAATTRANRSQSVIDPSGLQYSKSLVNGTDANQGAVAASHHSSSMALASSPAFLKRNHPASIFRP